MNTYFNQDSTCITIPTSQGFCVFNCDPFSIRFSKNTLGPLYIVQMLNKSNILAFVGEETNENFKPNELVLWDDKSSKVISLLPLKENITGVRLNLQVIVITTCNNAYVYNLTDMSLLRVFDTCNNPEGLLCLPILGKNIVLPSVDKGSVLIFDYLNNKEYIINCHKSPLKYIAIDSEGKKLLTASERGTIIRLWDVFYLELIKEYRRGLSQVNINNLVFSYDSTKILVSSDKGTMHIYNIDDNDDELVNKRSNLLSFINYLPDYYYSIWSAISYTIPVSCTCNFHTTDNSTIFTFDYMNNVFYIYKINNSVITLLTSYNL